MKNLVSSKTLRILNIIEATYFHKEVTVEEIGLINECSKNTVRADLEFIYERWQSILPIEIDHQKVRIDNLAMGDLMQVKETLFREEISLKFLINIFLRPHFTIYDHSIELNYSESHLRKTVNKLNQFLSEIDTRIEYAKDGMESRPVMIGDNEVMLYHLVTNLYMIGKFETVFPLEDSENQSVFELLLIELNLPITFSMRDYLDTLARITETRYKQGFYSREQLEEDYKNHFKPYKMADFANISSENMHEELKVYFTQSYLELHQSDFKMANDVVIGLLLRVIVSPRNIDDILNRYTIFHKKYSIEFPIAYTMFNDTLDRYCSLIGKDYTDFYGEIIYNLFIHVPGVRPYKGYRIEVYSDQGISHAFTLVQFIDRHFPGHSIAVYDSNDYYDIVFSTVSQNEELDFKNVYLISDLLGSDDIFIIYKAIHNWSRELDLEKIYSKV